MVLPVMVLMENESMYSQSVSEFLLAGIKTINHPFKMTELQKIVYSIT